MNKLFGRRWKIMVLRPGGQEAWNISDSNYADYALKCTFRIEKSGYQTPWYSDITIWNLDGDTQQAIFQDCKEGAGVIVEAGYQSGTYGKIFDGQIFQPLFDRQNVTDFIVSLNCIDGMGIVTGNICKMTLEAGYDYAGVISEMARQARKPIALGSVTPNLDRSEFPRGKVVFGEPKDYLREIGQANDAQFWTGDGKLNISKLDDAYEKEALVITPENGLIDTPQQTENGVYFRILLNPDLNVKYPPMVVKLDNTTIRQRKVRQGQLVSPLDQDGFYKVIKVVHTGDTRGNDWYTDVTGVNLVGNVSALLGMYKN